MWRDGAANEPAWDCFPPDADWYDHELTAAQKALNWGGDVDLRAIFKTKFVRMKYIRR